MLTTLLHDFVTLHARQGTGHPAKELLDVVARLGTRLDEHHVQLFGFPFTIFCTHLPRGG